VGVIWVGEDLVPRVVSRRKLASNALLGGLSADWSPSTEVSVNLREFGMPPEATLDVNSVISVDRLGLGLLLGNSSLKAGIGAVRSRGFWFWRNSKYPIKAQIAVPNTAAKITKTITPIFGALDAPAPITIGDEVWSASALAVEVGLEAGALGNTSGIAELK
jgi:hypothetical protein